jgi:hypothetical protein
MLQSLIERYDKLSDSYIKKILFYEEENRQYAKIIINCLDNTTPGDTADVISITFNDVLDFTFTEVYQKIFHRLIFATYISNENGQVVFDFDPVLYSNGIVVENDASAFKIKCRSIEFKLILV